MTIDDDRLHSLMGSADTVLERVRVEFARAVRKHGPMRSGHEGYAVIAEELDELWDEVKADQPDKALLEAVHVAAMAIRFVVDLEAKS